MSTKTKFAAVAIAAVTLGTSMLAATGTAEAGKWGHHGHGWGWAGAGLAAGLIGAGIASNAYASDYYYVSAPRCRWVRQFDGFGNYLGKSKVCNY